MYFKFLKVSIVSFLLAVGANSIMAQETLTFTEGQTITAGQEFHTSANVSIVIGSGETWEAAETLKGLTDGAYYCHAQGDCDYNKYKENTYPTSGCYYKLRSYVNGTITLKMALKVDVTGTKKLYVLPDDGTTIKGYSVVYNGVTYYPGGSTSANDPKKAENNYAKIYSTGDAINFYPCTLTFKVEPYKNYYIVGLSCENLAFAGYSFTPDKKEIPTYTPYVHQHVTNINGITMMYGGWLSEANAKKVDTESLHTNGDKNYNYYTIDTDDTKDNGHTDAWKKSVTDPSNLFHPLDGYTTYVSDCTNDAKNEQIDFYDSKTQGIASLPCRGTYYKFEPTVDGHLSVYLMQNGRIESDDVANPDTYGQLKTRRTLYFIDEFGVPQKAVYTKTNGVVDLPVAKLNDDAKKALRATIGSDYNGNYAEKVESTTDGGYFVYQKAATCYSFDVKAGKTYFLFANWSKLGLYGYTFGAAQTATTTADVAESGYTYAAQDNATVTLTRTLLAGTWNSLVLPFSMNETQVKDAFGVDTRVYYYNGVTSNKFNFLRHYYHVIQAGVPCLIVPSQVNSNNQYTIKGVTINSDATTVSKDGYIFTGTYAASTVMVAGSYFVGHEQNSTAARLYNTDKGTKTITGLRAYLKPETTSTAKVTGLSFDDDNSTVTAIEDVTTDVTVNNGNIYNLSGQLVKTGATNLDGLDKGIYILNGKKYVVK